MSVYMRAVLAEWENPPFEGLSAFFEQRSDFVVRSVDARGRAEFEALNREGTTVLAADLTTGAVAREELAELEELLDDLAGSSSARESVRTHLRTASAVIGMQILRRAHVCAARARADLHIAPRDRSGKRGLALCATASPACPLTDTDMLAVDEEHLRPGPSSPGALHRHSVGALTSRAAFPVTASAFAIA